MSLRRLIISSALLVLGAAHSDFFSGESVTIELGDQLDIDGHGWRVFVR